MQYLAGFCVDPVLHITDLDFVQIISDYEFGQMLFCLKHVFMVTNFCAFANYNFENLHKNLKSC